MSGRRRAVRTLRIVATGLLALTAIPGGLALIVGFHAPPVEMLRGSLFRSFVVPGLALTLVVGGSALAATVLLLRRSPTGPAASGVAGLVVMAFEFVQVVSIGSPPGASRAMQVGYFALGTLLVASALVAPRAANPPGPDATSARATDR